MSRFSGSLAIGLCCGWVLAAAYAEEPAVQPAANSPQRAERPQSTSTPKKSSPTPKDSRVEKERRRTVEILRTLQLPVAEVEFIETPLAEVMEYFKEQGLNNLVIQWRVLEDAGVANRETSITLAFENVTLGAVLETVLAQASLAAPLPEQQLTFHIYNGILHISTRADFNRTIVTRTYEVEHLLYPINLNVLLPYLQVGYQKTFLTQINPVPIPGAGPGGSGGGGIIGGGGEVINFGTIWGPGHPDYGRPAFKLIRETELTKLIELLKTIHPESWQENGGVGVVHSVGAKLVITQNVEMHELIGGTFSQIAELQKNNPAE
ncbi:MAG: hypothetical protein HJJLKODD_00734 [Phycisphaerae bacterium]|nr:hypothetical protein [Phycisphaerae bacterium]